eukprot:803977_1
MIEEDIIALSSRSAKCVMEVPSDLPDAWPRLKDISTCTDDDDDDALLLPLPPPPSFYTSLPRRQKKKKRQIVVEGARVYSRKYSDDDVSASISSEEVTNINDDNINSKMISLDIDDIPDLPFDMPVRLDSSPLTVPTLDDSAYSSRSSFSRSSTLSSEDSCGAPRVSVAEIKARDDARREARAQILASRE